MSYFAMITADLAASPAFPDSRGFSKAGRDLSFHELKSLTVICLADSGSANRWFSSLCTMIVLAQLSILKLWIAMQLLPRSGAPRVKAVES